MCALRLRSIQRAVFLSCFLIGTAPAQAESDLQKFVATVPPQVAFEFSMYNTCAIVASLKKKKDALFQEKEMAIANECKKYITQAERDLAQARFPADQRAKIIERFSFLASTERRLRAEGKAIPGYQARPETTELMECLHKLDAAKAVYSTCVDEALRNLIPLSTDTSDVVADAALGMCAVKRNEMVTSLTCSSMTYGDANAVVSQFDRQLRSSALGKVAAARAAMRQRELMQQQVPKAAPPQRSGAPNSKHDCSGGRSYHYLLR